MESLLPASKGWALLILTEKGVIVDDKAAGVIPNSITLTQEGSLCSIDGEGNAISSVPFVNDIELIEWGAIKKDLSGFVFGLAGLVVGLIGLFFLPSRVMLIEAVEAGLCLLGVLLAWVSLVPSRKAYLLCKNGQRSIMFMMRVPIEIAAPGILEFIAEVHAACRINEATQSEKNKEENPLRCA